MSLTISITTRLKWMKSLLAFSLLATVLCTWPLWWPNRYYPVFPDHALFASVNHWVACSLPFLLAVVLLLAIVLRNAHRLFLLAAGICFALLLLDMGRTCYWFYFYTVLLLLFGGYSGRVDNARHYMAYYNVVKLLLAGIYAVATVQHSNASFIHQQWPAYIKPFERLWTPEQCAYLIKCAYLIPAIDIFIATGLFVKSTRLAAICFGILFHLFSSIVVLLQQQLDLAVLIWQGCMLLLLPVIFLGRTNEEKTYSFSFGLFPLAVVLVFALAIPGWCVLHDKPLRNKLDLMEANTGEQFVYLDKQAKEKLPLYVQSFAVVEDENYYKLSVTRWALHETRTRQVLGASHLMELTEQMNRVFGTPSVVAIPASDQRPIVSR